MRVTSIILVGMSLPAICLGYLRADLDYSGKVDFNDFAIFSSQWLQENSDPIDGKIQLRDLAQGTQFGGRRFSSLTAQALGDDFVNGRNKLFQITNVYRVHDLCYEPLTGRVWGIDSSTTGKNYIFSVTLDTETTKTWKLGDAEGYNRGMACTYDRGKVWFAVFNSPADLIEMNPITDQYVTHFMNTGENQGTGVCSDGTYIYMCLWQDPAKIIKFDPSDNSHICIIVSGTKKFYWIASGADYIWAVGQTSAGNVCLVRLDPSDDGTTIYDLHDESSPHHVAFDGNYVWVVTAVGHNLIRFDIDNEDFEIIYLSSRYGMPYLLEFDGRYMWLGFYSGSLAYIARVSPHSMLYEIHKLPDELAYLHAMCFDGTHLWFSSWSDSCYVMKWAAYGGPVGGKAHWIFDGGQESIQPEPEYFVDTHGMNLNEDETQVPVLTSTFIIAMGANILNNSCDGPTYIRLRKNGSDVDSPYIYIEVGDTGQFSCRVEEQFSLGDLLSIRVFGGGSSGTIDIGKITLLSRH